MPHPNPKQAYHHGDTKLAAMRAAVAQLRNGEVELPTIRELATEIGVSHRALYRHFADKDALRDAVASVGFQLLGEAMTRSERQSPQTVMEGYLRFAFAEPTLYHLMFSLRSTALLAEPIPGPQVREVIAIATRAFGNQEGAEEVKERVVSAWGMAHGLFELWRVGALRASSPESALSFIMLRLARSGLI